MSSATVFQPGLSAAPDIPLDGFLEGVEEDQPYLISADSFLAAIERGLFAGRERLYLRDGRIYEKMSKTNAHSVLGLMVNEALMRRLPPGWKLFPEGQFKVDDINSRLPDFALARCDDPRAFLTPEGYPQARDLGLVVEIAVSSLSKDLNENLERFARALVPCYWVADFSGRRIVSHTAPRVVDGRGEYEFRLEVVAGGTLPLVLDGQEVARFAYEDLMP